MSTSTQAPTGERRIPAYDALRVFAIATVVAIHAFMPLRGVVPERSLPMVIDDLLHYAVPLFVFISGALIWSRPWPTGKRTYGEFMSKRLVQVGLPYLTWAFVFLLLLVATSPDPGEVLARAPGLLLTGHVWYHLYFIPMLLTFYALTPLASRALRARPELVVLIVYAARITLWPAASAWIRDMTPSLTWSYATHIATHLPHMALGAWFALRYPILPRSVRRAWPVLLIGGTAVLLASSLGMTGEWPTAARRLVYPLGMAATIVGLALAGFAVEPLLARVRPRVIALSSLALGVYFVHPLWLLVAEKAVATAGMTALWLRPWAVPAAWATVGLASLGSAWLLTRSRWTAWLVGARTRACG
jgi:surface polysaccharide O-acyltransferase-like enzyme